uniref:Amino acid permease-like protein n=1 Tax=Tanacetum cinerariifolium TaxID=118510 RepID=A0A6L2NJL4_TANCI|nr:amino acid permease-like protein [Tanacetum cinerariifolium]
MQKLRNTGNKPTSIPMVGHNIQYLGITQEDSPRANADNNIKKISTKWVLFRELWKDGYCSDIAMIGERGMLPEFFDKRPRYGTTYIRILFSASGVILLSQLTFQGIVAAANFLYRFGIILEFIAFVRLRMKYTAVSRLYKIPVGTTGAFLMCVHPTISTCVVLALSTFKVMGLSVFAVVIGLVLQPFLKYVEKKRWVKFSMSADLPDLHNAHETKESLVR